MAFSFFRSKKDPSIPIKNKVLTNKTAKWEVCKDLLHKHPETIFIAWFEDSASELKVVLQLGETESDSKVMLATRPGFHHKPQGNIIFVERYPLKAREQEFFKTIGLSEVSCYCSLDDALLEYFGSQNIASLMQKMGMKENEVVESGMIDNSIERAQERLDEKIVVDQSARSQREWMERNLPKTGN